MINEEAQNAIRKLEAEYEVTWGQKVDYTIIPRGMSQENLVMTLQRMIDTGESLLVAFSNI